MPTSAARANETAEQDAHGFAVRQIGPIALRAATREAAVAQMREAISTRSGKIFAFCNMHTANMASTDPAFASALEQMTVFNDGLGIDLASKFLFGAPFPENLNGTDLMPALLAELPRARLFLLGSRPDVAVRAASLLQKRHPHLVMAGQQHGFFSHEEGEAVAERIRRAGADVVLVGMGHPRQEIWAVEWGRSTGAVIICVGAFIDFTAGVFTRAPGFVRAARCEWFYRFLLEPRRLFRRYFVGAPTFFLTIARHRLSAAGGSHEQPGPSST